jgi:hypothetical protein
VRDANRRFDALWLLLGALSSAAGAAGQTLKLAPASGAAGDWVTVAISLQTAPGHEPAALQWDIEIANQLEPETQRIARALLAVTDAGKFLTCSNVGRTLAGRLLRCVLAGGQKPILPGAMVLLPLRITDRAQPGAARVRLDHALAVTTDLKQVPIDSAETVITIQAR